MNTAMGVYFVVFGLGMAVFRRAAARHTALRGRFWVENETGRVMLHIVGFAGAAALVGIGAFEFFHSAPSVQPFAPRVPGTGLTQDQAAAIVTFVAGVLLLVFHRAWMRWNERQQRFFMTPAGENINAFLFGLFGLVFAGAGLLQLAGVLQ